MVYSSLLPSLVSSMLEISPKYPTMTDTIWLKKDWLMFSKMKEPLWDMTHVIGFIFNQRKFRLLMVYRLNSPPLLCSSKEMPKIVWGKRHFQNFCCRMDLSEELSLLTDKISKSKLKIMQCKTYTSLLKSDLSFLPALELNSWLFRNILMSWTPWWWLWWWTWPELKTPPGPRQKTRQFTASQKNTSK